MTAEGAERRRRGRGEDFPALRTLRSSPPILTPTDPNWDKGIMQKVNLSEKLDGFSTYWDPKVVGELNDQMVKLVKLKGPFVWHRHEQEDELFLVLKGELDLEFRDRTVKVGEGEFIIVPRGVEHRPVAQKEVHILLFEPATVLNTGNVRNERTVEEWERI